MIVFLLLAFTAVGLAMADEEKPVGDIYVVRLEGAISPGTAGFLSSSVKRAVDEKAQALIIELDTPGGLGESMRSMVKDIMNAPLPVIVYVSPSGAQAASAGVMITMAADVAAMAPGTNIGAAHPVSAGGQDIDGEMAKKVVNDMVAFIQSIAKERGRNLEWAQKAVEESVSVDANEAVKLKVVDLVAENRNDLLRQLDKRKIQRGTQTWVLNTDEAGLVELRETLRDRVLKTLANPNIAYILMMIGLAGLYFEFSNPGTILPGVVGGVCLILAFYSFQTLPVNYAGILLIILGIVFFVLEIKITSFGMLSVAGLITLTLGSLMLFKDSQTIKVSLNVILPVVITMGGFMILLATVVVKAHVKSSQIGLEAMLGLKGPVKEWSGLKGKVVVHGEWWAAICEEELEPGDMIEVTGIEDMRLKVRRLPGSDGPLMFSEP